MNTSTNTFLNDTPHKAIYPCWEADCKVSATGTLPANAMDGYCVFEISLPAWVTRIFVAHIEFGLKAC